MNGESAGVARRWRASSNVAAAARQLRRRATPSEAVLWEALRGRRLVGLKFRRQHPIDRFIVDFYCPAARVVIELDGGLHDAEAQSSRDATRADLLAQHAIRILRFSNDYAIHHLPAVLAAIHHAVSNPPPLLDTRPPPSPVRQHGRGGQGG